MRLGGPVFGETSNPDSWAEAVKNHGYSAAYCPVNSDSDEPTIEAYVEAARKADIIIAEVGAWSNPISFDDAEREAALEKVSGATRACRSGRCKLLCQHLRFTGTQVGWTTP